MARTVFYATVLAAVASQVAGHTIVSSVWVNGKDTADAGVGVSSSYMRGPGTNSPVEDVTSAAIACNVKGEIEASGFLQVAAGDTLEAEWYHSGGRGADPIDPSHNGPLTTWIAPYAQKTSGDVWVQIGSEAYYDDAKQWAVAKMIANKGRSTVTLPKTLAPGKYLIRFDLLALHSAGQYPGAQFYPNCAQVEVTEGGSQELPKGVALPGFIKPTTPGVAWIYYSSEYDITGDYVAPGTGVWDGSASYSTETCTEQIFGLAPAGYCQGNSSGSPAPSASATKPATTSAAATTSGAAVTTTSAAVTTTTSQAPVQTTTTSRAGSSSSAAISSSSAATSSSAAAPVPSSPSPSTPGQYTDYNECMRAYNKCLDAAQSKTGGAVDFSKCYAEFECSALQRRMVTRRSPPSHEMRRRRH
ncbi:hypothetical protein Rhopal_002841-T1 [Rhodotorula paludigena]|uniref:AA9 family lytic polysaccharide monooxygenase n=1 Tax=Rhodotorula paludigena TaxID=86838 RepID=A0AAV5GK69_9BASI|nr:hypothetical protein Rhopal_002841-T1 [Rhodotorula paludigena]